MHGDGVTPEKAVMLTLYLNGADGRYLLKGKAVGLVATIVVLHVVAVCSAPRTLALV